MNGAKIYHSNFWTLKTFKLRHILFRHHDRYTSIQATSIVQIQLKILSYYEVKLRYIA